MIRVAIDCITMQLSDNSPTDVFSVQQREDPRLFVFEKDVWASYTLLGKSKVGGCGFFTQIACAPLLTTEPLKETRDVREKVFSMRDVEKNWIFFEWLEKGLWCIYNHHPLVIYKVTHPICSDNTLGPIQMNWTWKLSQTGLVLRGGAPPVLPPGSDRYYVFIHSSIYDVYVLTVSIHNLKPMGFTEMPIIAAKCLGKSVVFPCGALYNTMNDQFTISMGIDDRVVAFAQFGRKLLDACITPVQVKLN